MTPEQEPIAKALSAPDLNNTTSSTARRQVPLSIKNVAIGAALIELDKNNLPHRIELIQRSNKQAVKAFEITIEEPSLRKFFDLESLQSADNENTLVSIYQMFKAANAYARAQGLIFPTEEREAEKSSLCRINVQDSNHTISYTSSHIPISIEEWTYGHKRHQVTTERRDGQGNLLCELRTKSLEFPDGSIVADVTIVSHLKKHESLIPYHFITSARGPNAHSTLDIELESLHDDIAKLSVDDYLRLYFAAEAKKNSSPLHIDTVIESSQKTLKMRVDQQVLNSSYEEGAPFTKEKIRGEFTFTSGSKIEWDCRDNQDQLNIYPGAQDSQYYMAITRVDRHGNSPNFSKIVENLADESRETRTEILRQLTAHSYKCTTHSANARVGPGVLTDFLLDEIKIPKLTPLIPSNCTNISMSEKIAAALDGMEWTGYQRHDNAAIYSDAYRHIPYQIFLRVWQGACDKIILNFRTADIQNIEIVSKNGALFSGSIPEMRAEIAHVLKIFNENPFKLLESYHCPRVSISSVFDRDVTSTFLHRLNFFSELLIEDSKKSNDVLTGPSVLKELLYGVAASPILVISSAYFNTFRMHFHFHNNDLEKVSIAKKFSFFESFFHRSADKIIFEQAIPKQQYLSPKEVISLSQSLYDAIHYYCVRESSTRPTHLLFDDIRSKFPFLKEHDLPMAMNDLTEVNTTQF